MVRRLEVSRSFGSLSVISFKVTLSCGHRLILVVPAIASRYPVARSTCSRIGEVKNPDGIPTISSRTRMTMTAATIMPAIFNALMSTFQPGQNGSESGWA